MLRPSHPPVLARRHRRQPPARTPSLTLSPAPALSISRPCAICPLETANPTEFPGIHFHIARSFRHIASCVPTATPSAPHLTQAPAASPSPSLASSPSRLQAATHCKERPHARVTPALARPTLGRRPTQHSHPCCSQTNRTRSLDWWPGRTRLAGLYVGMERDMELDGQAAANSHRPLQIQPLHRQPSALLLPTFSPGRRRAVNTSRLIRSASTHGRTTGTPRRRNPLALPQAGQRIDDSHFPSISARSPGPPSHARSNKPACLRVPSKPPDPAPQKPLRLPGRPPRGIQTVGICRPHGAPASVPRVLYLPPLLSSAFPPAAEMSNSRPLLRYSTSVLWRQSALSSTSPTRRPVMHHPQRRLLRSPLRLQHSRTRRRLLSTPRDAQAPAALRCVR